MPIFKLNSKLIVVTLVASLGLSACVIPVLPGMGTGGGRSGMTATELELHNRSRAMQKTILEGLAIGAGTGAVISAVSGGDTVRGALIGAAVGVAAGSYLAHLQRNYADKESRLVAAISDLQGTNAEARLTLSVMRRVVDAQLRELAQLRRAVANGSADQSALNAELRDARANLRDMDAAADGAAKREREFSRAQRRGGLDDGNGAMDRELDELANRVKQMRDVAQSLENNV